MFTNVIKDCIRRSCLYEMTNPIRQQLRLRRWEKHGRPTPPPHLAKRAVVVDYARRFGLRTLVESGTNLGYMVNDVRNEFRHIISIEIDPALFARAKRKFKCFPHISLIHGDSSEVLPQVVAGLSEPCLFWLDAHDANQRFNVKFEPPIMQELDAVLSHPVLGHVALVDDAWRFGKFGEAYPSVDELVRFAGQRGSWRVEVRDDIIRIFPSL